MAFSGSCYCCQRLVSTELIEWCMRSRSSLVVPIPHRRSSLLTFWCYMDWFLEHRRRRWLWLATTATLAVTAGERQGSQVLEEQVIAKRCVWKAQQLGNDRIIICATSNGRKREMVKWVYEEYTDTRTEYELIWSTSVYT